MNLARRALPFNEATGPAASLQAYFRRMPSKRSYTFSAGSLVVSIMPAAAHCNNNGRLHRFTLQLTLNTVPIIFN